MHHKRGRMYSERQQQSLPRSHATGLVGWGACPPLALVVHDGAVPFSRSGALADLQVIVLETLRAIAVTRLIDFAALLWWPQVFLLADAKRGVRGRRHAVHCSESGGGAAGGEELPPVARWHCTICNRCMADFAVVVGKL